MLELWWPTFALPWPVVLIPQNCIAWNQWCMVKCSCMFKMCVVLETTTTTTNQQKISAVLTVSFFSDMEMQAKSDCWRERLKAIDLCHLSFWLCLYIHYDNCFEARSCWGWWLCDVFSCTSMMGRPLMRLKTRRLEPQLTKEAFMRSANLEVHWTGFCFLFIF